MSAGGLNEGEQALPPDFNFNSIQSRNSPRPVLVSGSLTNPDPSLTRQDRADPNRSQAKNNPLTYYERYLMVRSALVEAGLSPDAARARIWLLDSKGLVTRDRLATLPEHKRPYAQQAPFIADLVEAVRYIRPTALIGVSGQSGSFTEEALREMSRHCERPIVFPLSNPTAKAECTPEQAYAWTDGAALVASGSPFPPVTWGGRLLVPGQCNNMYIFPGVGMGAVSCQASGVTDAMFHAAARTLAEQVGEDSLGVGRLYPDLAWIREISARIAAAVCEVAFEQGLTGIERPADLEAFIRGRMFHPHYVPYEPV